MAPRRVSICLAAIFILAIYSLTSMIMSKAEVYSVLTLDASNFSDTIAKHPFILIKFYTPKCQHCQKLAPEYEKAASEMSKHDPPVVFAKVNVQEEQNRGLAVKYGVNGFPSLKIFRSEGKSIQDYQGPREAKGIIEYIKKQVGPASTEIKSVEDVNNMIIEKKVFIVGIFQEFAGEEFKNFITVAEKLRSDYEFLHTLEAEFLPAATSINLPTVRLFKPFDDFSVDFKDFDVAALENFIQSASVPIITTYNLDPDNEAYITKFYNNHNAKAMLFLDFNNEDIDAFKIKYREAVDQNKGKNISFLIGNLDESKSALEFYGLKEEHAPLIILQGKDGQRHLQQNLQPDQIATFLNDYMEGRLMPFKKSEPIPEANDEPVKVVVADNFDDLVSNSGKNVLIKFCAPWCGQCTKLAPIYDEVAISFENDDDVVIATIDATVNYISKEFEVEGFPTIYFSSSKGKLIKYDGYRTTKDITSFIQENRDGVVKPYSAEHKQDYVKDEL